MKDELIDLVLDMVEQEGYNQLSVNLTATDLDEVFHFNHDENFPYSVQYQLCKDVKIITYVRKDFFLARVKKVLKEY